MNLSNQKQNPKNVRLLMWANVFIFLFLIVQIFGLILSNWKILISDIAWNITDKQIDRYNIETATVDGDGSVWFVAQRLRGDNFYEVRHVIDDRVETWQLPSLSFEEIMTISVLGDEKDQPWLVIGERLAHWNGDEWEFIPTPFNADIQNFISPQIVVKDSILWGLITQLKVLVLLN